MDRNIFFPTGTRLASATKTSVNLWPHWGMRMPPILEGYRRTLTMHGVSSQKQPWARILSRAVCLQSPTWWTFPHSAQITTRLNPRACGVSQKRL